MIDLQEQIENGEQRPIATYFLDLKKYHGRAAISQTQNGLKATYRTAVVIVEGAIANSIGDARDSLDESISYLYENSQNTSGLPKLRS